MRRKMLIVGMVICLLVLGMSLSAHAFTSLVAYGDSLTDDGDTGAFPFPDGVARFTDQKVWVELLADATGSKLYDVAFGGATTGFDMRKVNSTSRSAKMRRVVLSAVLRSDTRYVLEVAAEEAYVSVSG